MFSFHKPKIYRSNLGCCICKAKSSSSRFTDSKKYENEFERCFRIQEKRSGEICNACVLLVKRWKKLSPENRLIKHWHHVVDARAGPGTKLTGNRRLTNSASNNSNSLSTTNTSNTSKTNNSIDDCSSTGGSHQQNKHHNKQQQFSSSANSRLTDVLPLSSSQANNQATSIAITSSSSLAGGSSSSSSGQLNSTGSIRRRTGSWSSNKARAIDTNVSTFTFGEPTYRRSYMASEPSYSSTSSSSLYKPQSALNSGAFESVIKRFRQRQQQQQLEAQRRQLNKQQRQLNNQPNRQSSIAKSSAATTKTSDATQTAPEKNQINYEKQQQDDVLLEQSPHHQKQQALPDILNKRLKRSSESIGSLSIDGVRVSTFLDNSIWRKEKICCGVIFRGLNNEIAVFPKLIKPCQARIATNKKKFKRDQDLFEVKNDEEDSNTRQTQSPPPRATKSGSISSCDSNTSGTGSMEQPLDERPLIKHRPQIIQKHRRKSSLKPLEIPDTDMDSDIIIDKSQQHQPKHRANIISKRTSTRRANADTDSTTSSNSSSAFLSTRQTSSGPNHQQVPDSPTASSASSSGASSSRLMLMADDDELVMDEDEEVESNTDSSVESLNEMERKKSITKTVGALG